jgi:hypothetical protein
MLDGMGDTSLPAVANAKVGYGIRDMGSEMRDTSLLSRSGCEGRIRDT